MSESISTACRQQIVVHKKKGRTLREISDLLGMSYATVRKLWYRYVQKGEEGFQTNYTNCGRKAVLPTSPVYRKTLELKQKHPSWGTPRLRLALLECLESERIPCIRTLQQWLRRANLIQPRHKHSEPTIGAARAVHNIWQVDAKERLMLGDGTVACYLTIVDSKSGACLSANVFPL
jgi:hypothetical protein